uniref:SCP domain-containing protein n=1 Tax=Angiostrongylus cantonensis TaxID=6313 RepID=A0A0K0DLH9_ANGCA
MLKATLLAFSVTLLMLRFCSGAYETPFRCEDKSLSDQTRQRVLDSMNTIRSTVALGEFQAMNSLPSASDMMKLKWDCNLEAMAFTKFCVAKMPNITSTNGINHHYFEPGTPGSTLRNPIETAVLLWTEIKSAKWPANNSFDGNPVLRNFANLIRSNTTAVGCSSTWCGDRASVACVFPQPNIGADNDTTADNNVYGNLRGDNDTTADNNVYRNIGADNDTTADNNVYRNIGGDNDTTAGNNVYRNIGADNDTTADNNVYRYFGNDINRASDHKRWHNLST